MIFYYLAVYTDQLLALSLLIVLVSGLAGKISAPRTFFVISTAVISWLVGGFIKAVYWLPRPYLISGKKPLVDFLLDGSFPSNHAMLAFSLAFSMLVFNRRIGIWLLFISLLISAGRILAGVHTVTDISGAAVISGLLVWLLIRHIYPKLLG